MQPFVYFDLGKVLVDFEHEIAIEQLAMLADESAIRIQEIAFTSGLQERYETGLVTSAEYVAEINSTLKKNLDDNRVLEAISAIFSPKPEILPILEMLRSRNIPIGLLSNTCLAHWEWIAKQNWQIPGDWFEFHVLSFEVQSMKPDAKIYEVCEARAGRSPEQIFFTDDKPENIEAARERGWNTHLFRGEVELEKALLAWLGD